MKLTLGVGQKCCNGYISLVVSVIRSHESLKECESIMALVPKDFVNYKSTPVFSRDNVPKMLLHMHNTKAGVYGQIQVLTGSLKFYGFTGSRGELDKEIIIRAGETAISHPEYWHKVELLTEDTQFRLHFYAHKDSAIAAAQQSERSE